MVDFFEHQEQARKQTRRLIGLLLVAVVAVVLAINSLWIGGHAVIAWTLGHPLTWRVWAADPNLRWVTLATLLVIAAGMVRGFWLLRAGGTVVAEMAGGRLIAPATRHEHERRLVNVVEEMALAAGIAAPQVYVLDAEAGINAFAAGYGANDAVVAVSRGALERLNRDELQGVVAHEFAHIRNGDMRLNLKLMALLHGLLAIHLAGRLLMQASMSRAAVTDLFGRTRQRRQLMLTSWIGGLLLRLIGAIGVLAARLIKAAISRQREFLADAAAVQFTRNPDGIGGALRKIGGHGRDDGPGSRITAPRAEALSHLFMAPVGAPGFTRWMATHPPLDERIRRIHGRFDGYLAAPVLHAAVLPDETEAEPTLLEIEPLEFEAGLSLDAALITVPGAPTTDPGLSAPATAMLAAAGAPDQPRPSADAPDQSRRLPAALRAALHDGEQAQAAVYILLCPTLSAAALSAALGPYGAHLTDVIAWLQPQVAALPATARLPLLDLATPALRGLRPFERAAVLDNVTRLARADGHVSLVEFIVEAVLQRRLGPAAGRARPVRAFIAAVVRPAIDVVLSVVAHVASQGDAVRADAGFRRGMHELLATGLLSRPLERVAAGLIDYDIMHQALDHLDALPPLKKALLMRGLLAVAIAPDTPGAIAAGADARDAVQAIAAAIDVPLPDLGVPA